jgi:hypothetical protein
MISRRVIELWQISSKNKLKAIHNVCGMLPRVEYAVANIVKEQIESNSQLHHWLKVMGDCCGKYRQRTN